MVQKFKKPFHDQERLTKVKKFIEKYWETHHYSPSGPEIAAEFGVVESVTRYWRKRLEFDGYLEVVPSPQPPRTWVPVAIFAYRPVFPNFPVAPLSSTVDTDVDGAFFVAV